VDADNVYSVVFKGKVTMEDGTAPTMPVSVERLCSDSKNGTPGPLVSKKGEWVWRLDIDAFAQRACTFRAVIKGYTSTEADASHINITSRDPTYTVPTLILMANAADPTTIRFSEDSTPPKAKPLVAQAMKALDAHDYQESRKDLLAAVTGSPKFAQAWHALGLVNDNLEKDADARDAFTHAIDADPKMMPSYVMLARICIKTKDWQCALKTSDSLIKLDIKHAYPEIYLHRAVAQYQLQDLTGAQASIEEALRLDTRHKRPRAEYVEGRILEAKGDLNGAREHISKYLGSDPNAPDAEAVKAHLELLGKNAGTEPELETF
jgi:Tfp pilus assembly protein PilF